MLIKDAHITGLMAQACNASYLGAEAGGLQVIGLLHNQFESTLGHSVQYSTNFKKDVIRQHLVAKLFGMSGPKFSPSSESRANNSCSVHRWSLTPWT